MSDDDAPAMPPHAYTGDAPYVGGLFTLKPCNTALATPYRAEWGDPSVFGDLTSCWLCESPKSVACDDELGLCDRCIDRLKEGPSKRASYAQGGRTSYGLHHASPHTRRPASEEDFG